VVIEEDGKTEEEFLADLAVARDQLQELSDAACVLAAHHRGKRLEPCWARNSPRDAESPSSFPTSSLKPRMASGVKGKKRRGNVLCDVIRGTDFADLHAPGD
jgi:hypothetical protein